MIVAKNCYFWSVFPQISCGGYPQNSSKFPKPHFLLTCTYFGGRRHGRNLPMAKATDGLAFGITRHCRIEGLPPMPPTPMKQGSMDRAKGFTHIPQEIKNGNHHASIHAVHFGKFFFSLMYGRISRNDVFGRCGCLLWTWLGRIVKFIGILILNPVKTSGGQPMAFGGIGIWFGG